MADAPNPLAITPHALSLVGVSGGVVLGRKNKNAEFLLGGHSHKGVKSVSDYSEEREKAFLSRVMPKRFGQPSGLFEEGGRLKRNNHYVPELLLKRFVSRDAPLATNEYRLLVEHENSPEWSSRPISAAAKFRDHYIVAGQDTESDKMETWLDETFENPAEKAIAAAISNKKLSKDEWLSLIRFYAAQYVRVPFYYMRHRDVWAAQMDCHLSAAKDRLLARLPYLGDINNDILIVDGEDGYPLRYTIRKGPGNQRTLLLEHVTGRKSWMYQIREALRSGGPLDKVETYHWSILEAPEGENWFLTDNPALCIRRRTDGTKSLDSGWHAPGSKLMLALSPKHLLFTQVGERNVDHYAKVSGLLARQLRRDLADAAYRSFFCSQKDEQLPRYRPRLVNRERFQAERQEWQRFGQEQAKAERFDKSSL